MPPLSSRSSFAYALELSRRLHSRHHRPRTQLILRLEIELIEVSAEFPAKLTADLLAVRCDHHQGWPRYELAERESNTGAQAIDSQSQVPSN